MAQRTAYINYGSVTLKYYLEIFSDRKLFMICMHNIILLNIKVLNVGIHVCMHRIQILPV